VKRLAFTGAFLGAMVLAAVALGAPYKFSGSPIDLVTRFMKGGFYAGSGSVASTTNVVSSMLATTCDYDFASTANGYCQVARDKTCTLTGVKLGDPCFLGVGQALGILSDAGPGGAGDGGAVWYLGGELLSVRAKSTDTLELELCNRLGDGGALDPPDAGYIVRCISNQ
jgi:hypothetical protein